MVRMIVTLINDWIDQLTINDDEMMTGCLIEG
jgi:hypothetical protein